MDETSYWQAFERGTAIAVSADVERARALRAKLNAPKSVEVYNA